MRCGCCSNVSAKGVLFSTILASVFSAGVVLYAADSTRSDPDKTEPATTPSPEEFQVLHYTMNRIDGAPQNLAEYRGKVVLIVNVASECGLTPQYEGLEALYRAHKDQGLVILAFPANNFMGQEPGSDSDIATFCKSKYDVTFPLFSKISVKGDDIHPLYGELTALPEPLGGEVRWNFDKFLIDRQGNVIERYHPKVKPDAPELTELINKALAQPVPGEPA